MAFHLVFTQAAARGAQAARYGAQGVAKGARAAGKGVGGVLKGIRRGGQQGAQAAAKGGRAARGGAAGAMRQGARGAGRAVPTPRVRGAPGARQPPTSGARGGATAPGSPRGAWRAAPAGTPVRGASPAARARGSGGPKEDGARGGGPSAAPRTRELVGGGGRGGSGPGGRLRRRVMRGGRGGGDGGRRRGFVAPAKRAALRSGQLALIQASRSFDGGDGGGRSLDPLGGSDQPTGRLQRGTRRALGLAAVLPTLPLRPLSFVLRPRRTAKRAGRRVGRLLLSASVVLVIFSVLTVVMSFTDDGVAEVAPSLLPVVGQLAMADGPTEVPPGMGGGCGGLDPSEVQDTTRDLGRSGDPATEIPPEAFGAYCAAAAAFGVDWAILAAIGWRECNHGRYRAAGCHPEGTVNFAGARGPMQFLGSTWRGSAGTHDPDVAGPPVCFRRGERRPQDPGDAGSSGTGDDAGDAGDDPGEESSPRDGRGDGDSGAPPGDGDTSDPGTGDRDDPADDSRCERGAGYGTDGDRDGVADPWDWYDATYSAARLLLANRVDEDVDRAVFAYNRSDAYVEEVTRMAAAYREALGTGAPNGASRDGVAPPAGVTPRGGTEPYRDGHNTPTMQKVLDAVITHFGRSLGVGCFRAGDQDHGRGKACDVMVARGGRRPSEVMQRHGQALADWLVANAEALGVQYVIWEQRIWNIDRADEGWRRMGDRGSITQNHYDHVHISVQR